MYSMYMGVIVCLRVNVLPVCNANEGQEGAVGSWE